MSPEQILGKGVTGAADVFSLGAVLAYAATGEPPFPGDSSAALLYKVVHEEPSLGTLDGELRELVAACLAKAPSARPAPGEVARRLAPEGAARLVSGGWLPGPLVERVSRGAVRLLNLEAAGEPPGGVSGPVGFSRPSVTAEAAEAGGAAEGADGADAPGAPAAGAPAPGAPAPGVFGPPPVMPAPASTPPPAPLSAPTPIPTAPGTGVPAPREGDRPPGRLSVSVAATSTRAGEGGRGRRLSCTVALAVAGAMAAVTVGSVLVFDLLPGGERGDSAGDGGRTPRRPRRPTREPAGAPSPSPTTTSAPGRARPSPWRATCPWAPSA